MPIWRYRPDLILMDADLAPLQAQQACPYRGELSFRRSGCAMGTAKLCGKLWCLHSCMGSTLGWWISLKHALHSCIACQVCLLACYRVPPFSSSCTQRSFSNRLRLDLLSLSSPRLPAVSTLFSLTLLASWPPSLSFSWRWLAGAGGHSFNSILKPLAL